MLVESKLFSEPQFQKKMFQIRNPSYCNFSLLRKLISNMFFKLSLNINLC